MDYCACPFCHLAVSAQEIERHANDHLVDEELARDLELAYEVLYELPNSSSCLVDVDQCNDSNACKKPECSKSGLYRPTAACAGTDVDEKMCSLIGLQIKDEFYQIGDGLMALLGKSLESDPENATSILCGYIDHFESRESEDVGWGCGWRNIQMLSSHLLKQRPEARDVLYGGCGFVPDIASLQRWLEIAWKLGFDAQGSSDFDGEIYGKKNWIGTTECAALLRSFGLRAMVVDFCNMETKLGLKENVGKRKVGQVYGPMDKFLSRGDHRTTCKGTPGCEDCKYSSIPIRNARGIGVIVNWVWNYFSGNTSTKAGNPSVIHSEKAPLYFQHEGHSRTIIGIQATRRRNGIQQYNLLILDPAHRTEALEKSLKQNSGWQQQIKRGLHTLKKQQYQLCFIDPGIASIEEMEQLKTLCGIHCEL